VSIRRFNTTAELLAWTPPHDGQRARVVPAGPDYEWLAEAGWIELTNADKLTDVATTVTGVSAAAADAADSAQEALGSASVAQAAADGVQATADAAAAAANQANDQVSFLLAYVDAFA
jgi:hypothetical protein